jgi:hypothetical protein
MKDLWVVNELAVRVQPNKGKAALPEGGTDGTAP